MADPLKIITDVLRERMGAFAHDEAIAVVCALEGAGIMLVPHDTPSATKTKLGRDDLRVGMVCRMRKGGIRRIDDVKKGMWGDVSWTRIDPGPYCGRTGKMSAHYFAGEVMEVIHVG